MQNPYTYSIIIQIDKQKNNFILIKEIPTYEKFQSWSQNILNLFQIKFQKAKEKNIILVLVGIKLPSVSFEMFLMI